MLRKLLGAILRVSVGKFSKEEKQQIYALTLNAVEGISESFARGTVDGLKR